MERKTPKRTTGAAILAATEKYRDLFIDNGLATATNVDAASALGVSVWAIATIREHLGVATDEDARDRKWSAYQTDHVDGGYATISDADAGDFYAVGVQWIREKRIGAGIMAIGTPRPRDKDDRYGVWVYVKSAHLEAMRELLRCAVLFDPAEEEKAQQQYTDTEDFPI